MKKTKRFFAVLIVVLMSVTFISIPTVSATTVETGVTDDGWSYSITDSGIAWIGSYKGSDTEVTLPSEIKGYPVYGFADCILSSFRSPDNKVTKLIISDSDNPIPIKYFDNQSCLTVFGASTNLKEVVIGSLFATKLCDGMFSCCTNLEKVTFTDDFTAKANKVSYTNLKGEITKGCIIGNRAFNKCTKLKNIVIPEGVTSIITDSFFNTPIDTIVYPYSMTGWYTVPRYVKRIIIQNPDALLDWWDENTEVIAPLTGLFKLQVDENDDLTCTDINTVDVKAIIDKINEEQPTSPTTPDVTTPDVTIPDDTKPVDPSISTDPNVTVPDNTKPSVPAVTQPTQPITKSVAKNTTVTLKKTKGTVYRKGKTTIRATVKNGKGKTTYKSNNPKVAKVNSSGVITTYNAGTAKITVTNNKINKVFTLTVKNPKLNAQSKTLKVKKSYTLRIVGKVGKATFKSSNKKVAKVTQKGKIVAKKKGKATITVKTNGIKLICKVKVK